MYCYWINDNRKRVGGEERKGPILYYGRLVVRSGGRKATKSDKPCREWSACLQWKLLSGHANFDIWLEPHGDYPLTVTLSCWLFSLYLSVEARWLHRLVGWLTSRHPERPFNNDGRLIGVSLDFEAEDLLVLRLRPWSPMDGWACDQPWWWDMRWRPLLPLLGHYEYAKRDLEKAVVNIPMPELNYTADLTLFESSWQRKRAPEWLRRAWPRWPIGKRLVRAEVEMRQPIPIPGKGENSWDCGDDGLYSLTTGEQTVEGAIAAVVRSALETRRRYGGTVDWLPAARPLS